MRSFSFKDLLIRLSAKNLAEGGQTVMKQNIQATRQAIAAFEDLRDRQQAAARFRSSGSGGARQQAWVFGEGCVLEGRREFDGVVCGAILMRLRSATIALYCQHYYHYYHYYYY